MVTSIGARSQLMVQSLVDMRRQLDDLQRQLGTGKKSETYAGLGLDRGLTVSLRAQLTSLIGFGKTMQMVGLRLDIAQSALTRITEIVHDVKAGALQPVAIQDNGRSTAQATALLELDELIDLLNTKADGRYIFGGRAVDTPPVASMDAILNGSGGRIGLKDLIAERRTADLGPDGLGRLVIPAAVGPDVSISEDAASPFGFKLAGVTVTPPGWATVVQNPGPPADATVTVGAANASPGDVVTFTFNLPDGSQETIRLEAVTGAPLTGQFQIGADPDATAAHLEAALRERVQALANVELVAASAVAASDNFFNTGAVGWPLRVDPPLATSTALVPGTTDVVSWYTGETGPQSARQSALARIDESITIAYGLRADEEGVRWLVQHVAVFASMTFTPGDATDADRYRALAGRVGAALAYPAGVQKVEEIAAELGDVQATMKATKERHMQTNHTLQTLLDSVEGVSNEQVAAEILALQTRLQASLQTTSMLYRISLVNFM